MEISKRLLIYNNKSRYRQMRALSLISRIESQMNDELGNESYAIDLENKKLNNKTTCRLFLLFV